MMKTYNASNFFKYTFCEFEQVLDFDFPNNSNFKSKSQSTYFYADKGVYRKSNHWGRVANCRWKLKTNAPYKNQQEVIGFAKWTDFYPIDSKEKLFSITVDFTNEKAKLQPSKMNEAAFLFTFTEAQKRIKKIKHLFKDNSWLKYYTANTENLKKEIIKEYASTNNSLMAIKAKL